MLIRVLRKVRMSLRGTALATVLRRLGLSSFGRAIYERGVMRKGVHQLTLLGQKMRFRAVSPAEITRLDAMDRETPMLQKLLSSIRSGQVFYDIGANVGIISIAISKAASDRQLEIHAFEPEPRHAAELRANLALNGIDRVHVHELALSDASGQARFYVSNELGSGGHSLAEGHQSGVRAIDVRTMTAADFVSSGAPPPNVVKIDVEGSEMLVLKGMGPLLEQALVEDLFIEIHPSTLRRMGSSAEELERWLTKLGYGLAWREDMTSESHHHYHRGA